MTTIEKRLDRLRLVSRRPPPRGPSSFDPTRLSFAEQIELDDLLAPLAPVPGQEWDLEPLTTEQLARSAELMRKAEGRPPEPAYFGMPHRDCGIGPCRCVACDATPTPTAADGRPDPAA